MLQKWMTVPNLVSVLLTRDRRTFDSLVTAPSQTEVSIFQALTKQYLRRLTSAAYYCCHFGVFFVFVNTLFISLVNFFPPW